MTFSPLVAAFKWFEAAGSTAATADGAIMSFPGRHDNHLVRILGGPDPDLFGKDIGHKARPAMVSPLKLRKMLRYARARPGTWGRAANSIDRAPMAGAIFRRNDVRMPAVAKIVVKF
jgi:hypothetical protein